MSTCNTADAKRVGGFEYIQRHPPLTDLHVVQWTLDEAVVILHERACVHDGVELLPWLLDFEVGF